MMQNDDTDPLAYEDMQVLSFGLSDPCDWAATLSTNLLAASQALTAARKHHLDPAKDVTASTDEVAVARIRAGVVGYLAEVHAMLVSMPIMQQQPEILEALKFIVAAIADIDRGAAPDWLAVRATKQHPKRLGLEAEWVPIISALELSLLLSGKPSVDAAARRIHLRTGRAIGTIKDWHQKLYRNPNDDRLAAKDAIQQEVDSVRQVLGALPKDGRSAIIQRRIDELLA